MKRVAFNPGRHRIGRATLSWAAYDLANSIFVFSVLTIYFPLWIVDDMGGSDGTYGIANSISMALVFLTAPLIGTLSDQVPRRLPYLALTTVICCICTAFIGVFGLIASLILFVAANFAFQSGVIFYDTLLPVVSTDEDRGRVGALGVSLGYIGTATALGVGSLILWRFGGDADPLVFKVTGALFLLFAIPCFVWVPERRRVDIVGENRDTVRRTIHELRSTMRRAREVPGLPRFLFGRIFYADAANTLVAFVGIYATKEIGLSEANVRILIAISLVGAIVGGLRWGRVVDQIGPRRSLMIVLGVWALVLAVIPTLSYVNAPEAPFWLIIPISGVAYACLAVTDRPLFFSLAPPQYAGQLYGLFAMSGRFAALIGPLLWTAVVDWLELGRPAAMLGLLGMIVVALSVLAALDDAGRPPADWHLSLVGPMESRSDASG